jgi:uncharacterized protein YuzE
MKVCYDVRTDTQTITLKVNTRVAESEEQRPGVVLDYDARGDLAGTEILDASKRVTDAGRMEFVKTG